MLLRNILLVTCHLRDINALLPIPTQLDDVGFEGRDKSRDVAAPVLSSLPSEDQYSTHGSLPTPLHKRNDEEDDDLRARRIEIMTIMIPLPTASHTLEYFYAHILFNALALWANVPPAPNLVFTLGCLELTMNVLSNHGPARGISWAFVRNFARNMIAMTRRGFVGTYRMYYSSIYGTCYCPQMAVEVELRIRADRVGSWNVAAPRMMPTSTLST